MKEKGIWLLREMKPEHLKKAQEIAPDHEIIKGWEEDSKLDFPVENIEIVYGWNKDKVQQAGLLETEDSQLKWIQVSSAGVDYMDLAHLKEQGILLTNASGIHSVPIAESVFGMLLAYGRKIQQAVVDQAQHIWRDDQKLVELSGKTMMIVGTGHIGKEIGRLAKAFNMNTIGINRSGREVEYMDKIYQQPDLVDYVEEADVVINILPLTSETEHYFDEKVFSHMKEGTLFINVGRGPSVNTEDLIQALDDGKISFAGLDVFETEPLEKENSLWDRKDVLITPHISGNAEHYNTRLFEIFEENLCAYAEGKELPKNLIDYEKNY